MAANWYLVKYVPDPFRNEPRNIGVVVESSGYGVARFIGQHQDGLDGRKVRGIVRSPKMLRAWLEYLEYHLDSGTFHESVLKSVGRPGQSYQIEPRGSLLASTEETNLRIVAEELFHELVGEPAPSGVKSIDDLANDLLFRKLRVPANHKIERDVTYTVLLQGEPRELDFDYRYQNGRTNLLDKITLSSQDRLARQKVNDLLFRIEHARQDAKIENPAFVTLYDLGKSERSNSIESHLRAIERFSHTVNIRDQHAAEDVAETLGVPLLQAA
ncbi:hypothetical protein [Kitasatospora purpeofusca]|uniref:hypothetical protein n=1 Tax=Kitasatospora purpeofusca TaxID=67352 RepID=UPI0012FF1E6F|nr:hypothetical protein [Kitasatospora purpeofusca]